MQKINPTQISLQVDFIKQGKNYVAYSPAFDLSTSGKNLKEAQKRFEEAVAIFIEETVENKCLEKILKELGWQKLKTKWKPPQIVKQESLDFKVPIAG